MVLIQWDVYFEVHSSRLLHHIHRNSCFFHRILTSVKAWKKSLKLCVFTVLYNPPFNLTCHETTMNTQIIIGLAILTRPIAQAILILAIMFPNFMSAQIINSQGGNLSVQVTNSNSTVGIINQYQSDCHLFTSNKHDKIEKLLNCTVVPDVVIIFLRVPRSIVSKTSSRLTSDYQYILWHWYKSAQSKFFFEEKCQEKQLFYFTVFYK